MGAARWVRLSLALALAIGGGSVQSDEVYRWKDSQGRVRFGDRPDATGSQGAKRVVVPRPNLAKGLEPPPTAPVGSGSSGGETLTPPAALPVAVERPLAKPAAKRGFAAQRQDSCQAKWAAFWDSAACFGACGKTSGLVRNNAGCEHCSEQPMPGC